MIVDDDEIILKTVNAALVKAGHTVYLARDGHTAFEIANKENLHLIATDINMPKGLNGFNLVKMLRETVKSKDLPIIIISSRRSEFDVLKGIEVGVDDYIIKPVDFDIFVAKVSSLLKKGGHSFALSPVNASGSTDVKIKMKVVGISEEGLQVISAVELEVNSKISFQSEIFDDIGMNRPILRVAHCERLETDQHSYSIKLNFIGITSGDLQNIRVYCTRARLKPAT